MADDPYPVITRGGVGAGVRMWDHDAGEFTNENRVLLDEIFHAEGNAEPGGGGPGLILNNARDLQAGDILASLRDAGVQKTYFTDEGHFYLEVPVWGDQIIEGVSVRPGITSPTFQVYRGNVRMDHWASGDEGHSNIQFNHWWAVGTAIRFHLHVGLRAAAGTPAAIRFDVEYILGQLGQVDNAPVVISTGDVDISGLAQYREIQLNFPEINMAGFLESANMSFMLKRVAAAANDYAGGAAEAALKSADAHIRIAKLGSLTDVSGSGP